MSDEHGAKRHPYGAQLHTSAGLLGTESQVRREADLVCEALVREINSASRWTAVVDAWQALVHVRRMAREMEAEREHLSGPGPFAFAQFTQTVGSDDATEGV